MAIKPISLENLTRAFHKAEKVFLRIKDAVKSVNGNTADANGDITVGRVNYAGDLESTGSQTSTEEFIERSAGGARSINTGGAFLASIQGNRVHTGVVEESVVMTVTAATSGITAEIDEDDFKTAAGTAGTYTFNYTGSWDTDPENYGITVTGSPESGDTITVVWTAENRGTITVAMPSAFVSTGWNLYNHTDGYAKVVKYSNEYGYKAAGAYTKLEFSATLTGEKTTITPTSGAFTVPSDGYVWVTGGNSTTTEIWLTWSDWTESANSGVFAAYEKDEISVYGTMQTYFPNGLCRVGGVRDEINLSLGLVYVRIERMEYSAENLAAAIATGRDYECDTNYIYIVKEREQTHANVISGDYTADDHGIEYVKSTTVPVLVSTIYGDSLKNKLERDTLTISQQSLTSAQQAQVLANIGAASASDLTTLSGKVSSLTARSVSVPLPSSFAAGATHNTNLKTIIDADLPSGYKCLCIAGWDSGGAKIVLSQLRYYNNSYSFQAWNGSTSAYSDKSALVYYLAVKS